MAVAGNVLAQEIIEVGIQFALRNHTRVFAFQRSRSRVTRIGEKRFLARLTFAV
ncbi:hypothetical protein EVA_17925 [gut metagenome]|uniref:Uncharacterized protein n=1 Tax=gut metagenome TaxID=749906 RepID=J9FHR1_9ZZZZ